MTSREAMHPSVIEILRGKRHGRYYAAALLVGFVVLVIWGVVAGSQVRPGFIGTDDDHTDTGLYKAIVDRMDAGDGYYAAVAVEQPGRGFPTSPAMTVREPTLAWATAAVGPAGMYAAMLVLAGIAVVMTIVRFDRSSRTRPEWMLASVLASASIASLCHPSYVWVHDVWAGLLIYVGVLSRSSRHFVLAVIAVTAAALVRELAAPVIVVLGFVAWRRGRRSETIGWLLGLVVFAAFYLWHVHQVGVLVAAAGDQSPGWIEFGGWPFVVNAAWFSTILWNVPVALAAVVVPLALIGWLAQRGDVAISALAVLLMFVVAFSFVGRPSNLYWGALFGAVLLPGLAFAPRALVQIVRCLLQPDRSGMPGGPLTTG